MDTKHKAICGCCEADIVLVVNDDEEVCVEHPLNGCTGVSAIRMPDEVLMTVREAHRAQQLTLNAVA